MLKHPYEGYLVGHEAPHTPEGSLGVTSSINLDNQVDISCLYDELRPENNSHFRDNIIYLPLDEGGGALTGSGERLLYVVFYPEAGRATVQKAQRRHLNTTGLIASAGDRDGSHLREVCQSRDHRSARLVIDFAVANRLVCHFSLTYAKEPGTVDDGAHEFEKFVRRTRRQRGPFAWVQVVERGTETGRLHHHVLMDGSFAEGEVEQLWGNGFVVRTRVRSATGIRTIAGYLCKTFSVPSADRLSSHRYRISRHGIRPQAHGFVMTESEYTTFITQLAPGRIYNWYPTEPVAFHEYSTLWDPYKKVHKNLPESA